MFSETLEFLQKKRSAFWINSQNHYLYSVLQKVAYALALTGLGVGISMLVGMPFISPWIQLPCLLIPLGGLFLCKFMSKEAAAAPQYVRPCIFFLTHFCLAEGLFLGPLLDVYFSIPQGSLIVFSSLAITFGIFLGVLSYAYYAKQSGKNLSWVPTLLIPLTTALISLGILAWLTGLNSMFFLYSACGAGVFTLVLILDLVKVLSDHKGDTGPEQKFIASSVDAINIYLDLLNIFLNLLLLLSPTIWIEDDNGVQEAARNLGTSLFGFLIPFGILLSILFCSQAYSLPQDNNHHHNNRGYDPLQSELCAAPPPYSYAADTTPNNHPDTPHTCRV